MRCAWSSSGGKDSLLALLHAQRLGHRVTTMLTMFDELGLRSRSHGVDRSLMKQQAAALGLEFHHAAASWSTYEVEFVKALEALRATGHEGVVFGDIDLLPHREWEEKVCARASLSALLPLWQKDRSALAREVLQLGFKSVVVCVDHRFLTAGFCGREYDEAFIKSLPPGVDLCGENGEFHTFVYDGPCFNSPVPVEVEAIEPYEAPAEFGRGRYSFARLRAKQATPAESPVVGR